MPRDLLNIVAAYAAPDNDELMLRWLCEKNREYEDTSSDQAADKTMIRIIVKRHLDMCECDNVDLTQDNADSADVCMVFVRNGRRYSVTNFSVGGMIAVLQKEKRPLRNSNDQFRLLVNKMRDDVKTFCSAEMDRWRRSIVDLLE